MATNEVKEIRNLLKKFQDGYRKRDLSLLDDFMLLFVEDEELEVIGTDAIEPGEGEWCLGWNSVYGLVAGDWQGWGNLTIDIPRARIHVWGDVGWLATTGLVTKIIPTEEGYQDFLNNVEELVDSIAFSQQQKALRIAALSNDLLLGLPLGERFVWPLRFTAVVVKEDGEWLFHQMQFSFGATRAPDERIL